MENQFSNEQQFAFKTVLARHASGANLTVIKGAAGTGKTTLLSRLVSRFRDAIIVAPTNRAAKVLRSKEVYAAQTIHKAFYEVVSKSPLRFKPLVDGEKSFRPFDIVFCDEASMVTAQQLPPSPKHTYAPHRLT